MSFMRVLIICTVLISTVLVPKPLQVNFYSIPRYSELNSRYSLRFYNQQTADQSVVEFLYPDQDNSCLVAIQGDIRNETASYMDSDVADYYQILENDSQTCHPSNNLEYSDGVLTLMIADSPMVGYPDFPMIKDEPVFTLQGKTRYQLYEDEIINGKTRQVFTRLYANFDLKGRYIFVRTRYYAAISDEVKAEFLKVLDRVYEFYDGVEQSVRTS